MHLTREEENWSIKDVQEKINFYESGRTEWQTEQVKYLRLILKYKMVQDRKKLEDKIKSKLGTERVGGNYQPEQVAKVLGISKRQAMVIEKKALSKLKSPKLGRQIKGALFS